MRTSLVLFTVATLSLGLVACKKKETDAGQKPVEGSAAKVDPTKADPAKVDPNAPPPADPAKVDPGTTQVAPAATKNLVETAREAGTFTTLLKAAEVAGLVETLSAPGPITLFAPTDEAFAKIPAKDLEALLADKAKLTAVLTYHVVPGAVAAKDLATQKAVKSVQGGELPVDTSAGVKIGGATVLKADVPASNGVIHVIDTVLLPPG